MIPQALIHYVETEIIPRYEHFDKAHNRSHVQTVIDESLALAELVSGEIIAADSNLLQWFDKEEMAIMREAVEDHRASSDHEPRSIYGKIVAEADRIIDTDITLRRTVQYGLKQNPAADEAWHYQRFHKHLMKKYAPSGYLKRWLPDSKNAERLKELQSIIADEVRLKSIFHRMFEEEKR